MLEEYTWLSIFILCVEIILNDYKIMSYGNVTEEAAAKL